MARLVYRGVVIEASDETVELLSSDFERQEKKAPAKRTAKSSDSK